MQIGTGGVGVASSANSALFDEGSTGPQSGGSLLKPVERPFSVTNRAASRDNRRNLPKSVDSFPHHLDDDGLDGRHIPRRYLGRGRGRGRVAASLLQAAHTAPSSLRTCRRANGAVSLSWCGAWSVGSSGQIHDTYTHTSARASACVQTLAQPLTGRSVACQCLMRAICN